MRAKTTRMTLAVTALVLVLQWPSAAWAYDISGVVGQIGVTTSNLRLFIQFKLTDANQTAACVNGGPAGYAYVSASAIVKEIYAMLLVSKKGAQITCTLMNNTTCDVTQCTLQ